MFKNFNDLHFFIIDHLEHLVYLRFVLNFGS